MDGEDVFMASVEETPSTSRADDSQGSLASRPSTEQNRSEDEFATDQPSTSDFKFSSASHHYSDAYLQEILLSSPAHLFSCGLLPAEQLSATWEQWLCYLASSLTPSQWQGYWAAHAAVFGLGALPVHLCSFFNPTEVRTDEDHRRHFDYG
ncbi:unnamed protein product [Cylicocyclus nassatus]|uniref:Uncharacterized protein n=1 Tax=Cylicocyclus nassatus TaxID=53992 RepID=A0AA36GLN2_CYLNA|nr:unnamed protein product [Cylicocyclus nassatus]